MDERILELAEQAQLHEVDAAVATIRRRDTQQRPEGFDGTCGCGEVIPDLRIAAGKFNCTDCQSIIEYKQRLKQ